MKIILHIVIFVTLIIHFGLGQNASCERIQAVKDSMFSDKKYSTSLPPVDNQTNGIEISAEFCLFSILFLEDIKQSMTAHAYIRMSWDDYRLTWDSEDYDGLDKIELESKDIWHPQLRVMNAFESIDLFKEDTSYTSTTSEGRTSWMPGSIFHVLCPLDLRKFPNDMQTCMIEMCPINHSNKTVRFAFDTLVDLNFLIQNPGWKLLDSWVTSKDWRLIDNTYFSCTQIHFKLQRDSWSTVLNVVFPGILVSCLNNCVFLIPLESGENISFAVAVLLAMSVFLSMVSTMVPLATKTVPYLTYYLYLLLVYSIITVVCVIFTEHVHHMDEGSLLDNRYLFITKWLKPSGNPPTTTQEEEQGPQAPESLNYKEVARRLNHMLFILVGATSMSTFVFFFILFLL